MRALLADYTLLPDGLKANVAVRIDDAGNIAGIGPVMAVDSVRRMPGCVLMPGLVNTHSHAFQRAFRGRVQFRATGRSDFWSWRDAMYRTANSLSPEGVYAVSRLCFLEMALAGVTHVGEFHYVHHQADGTPYADPNELANRVIAAALDVGIRIHLLRAVYATSAIGVPLGPDQLRFRDASPDEPLDACLSLAKHPNSRVGVGLAPHSVRAVPGEWMPELASFKGPIHAHVAEQPAEVSACLQATGRSPLAVFAEGGLVTDRFTAVHLTYPSQGDLQIIDDANAAVCACPITEMDLGDGFLPLKLRSGRVSVGSDSHARIDLFEEARCLEMHARALVGRRNVLAVEGERDSLARRIIDIGTVEGTRCLGGLGSGISVGASADLVAVDLDRPAAMGVPPVEAVAFCATPEWVRHSWVAGHAVIQDGLHPRAQDILRGAKRHLGG